MADSTEIEFDDVIDFGEAEPDFTLLRPGTYPFTVVNVTKTHYSGSEKIPACRMIELGLKIENKATNELGYFKQRVYLCSSMLKNARKFLAALGAVKEGETRARIDWEGLKGKSAFITTKYRHYNDNTYLDVERYLAPGEKATAKANATYKAELEAFEAAKKSQSSDPVPL